MRPLTPPTWGRVHRGQQLDKEKPMKKSVKKLALSKETLRQMGDSQLSQVPGAYPISGMTNCSDCATYNTQCVTLNCTFTCTC